MDDLINYEEIFERHFFTNHSSEAERVESYFQKLFQCKDSVSFSNSAHLILAVIDEITLKARNDKYISPNINIISYDNTITESIQKLIYNLRGINSIELISKYKFNLIIEKNFREVEKNILKKSLFLIYENETIVSLILDFSGFKKWLKSASILITNNSEMADIIRCSRSSYGRKKIYKLSISANGRFSEFQGKVLNHYLQKK